MNVPYRVQNAMIKFDEDIEKLSERIRERKRIKSELAQDLTVADLSDLIELNRLLADSQYRKAVNFYNDLDTYVREVIPTTLANWFETY